MTNTHLEMDSAGEYKHHLRTVHHDYPKDRQLLSQSFLTATPAQVQSSAAGVAGKQACMQACLLACWLAG